VRVFIQTPRGNWVTLVDAETGEVLWRHDRVRYANITGLVLGQDSPHLPTDGLVTQYFPNGTVNVGNTPVVSGQRRLLRRVQRHHTVTSALAGPYIRVKRCDPEFGPDASFSRSVSCPGTRDILWDAVERHRRRA
jgi:hypothetical protein